MQIGVALNAQGQLRIKRVEHVGINQTYGIRLSCDQRDGNLIGHIVQLICSIENTLPRLLRNTALLSAQYKGNRGFRYPGSLCDVMNGDHASTPCQI